MKVLGLDYGAKRVGIASTDDSGEFALPREVLPNDPDLLERVCSFIKKEGIELVVMGESKNLDGSPNQILKEIKEFAEKLGAEGIDVVFNPEVYTSMEADQIQGRTDMRDASAAAIILKSYLDMKNNN